MFQFHLTFLRGCTMYVFLQQWPHCLVLESPFVFVYHWLGGTSQYIIAFRSTLSWDETTAATKHFCRPCAAAQLAPNKQSKAKARLLQVTQGLVCCLSFECHLTLGSLDALLYVVYGFFYEWHIIYFLCVCVAQKMERLFVYVEYYGIFIYYVFFSF